MTRLDTAWVGPPLPISHYTPDRAYTPETGIFVNDQVHKVNMCNLRSLANRQDGNGLPLHATYDVYLTERVNVGSLC